MTLMAATMGEGLSIMGRRQSYGKLLSCQLNVQAARASRWDAMVRYRASFSLL